ncbi:hypothetical protein E1H99_13285, partial [Enterococcus hirae]
AVAYKDDAFASAEQTMKVADPVVISTALPRFMSPGDTIDVPVTLTNTTSKSMDIFVDCIPTGSVSYPKLFVNNGNELFRRPLVLKAGAETRQLFHLVADGVGEGKVVVLVKTQGKSSEQFSDETFIPVRPAAPLEKRTGSGEVAAGSPATLDLRTDFLPSSLRSKMLLS